MKDFVKIILGIAFSCLLVWLVWLVWKTWETNPINEKLSNTPVKTYCSGLTCDETCKCDKLPNGICKNGKCCYKQDCNNVYCGDDGCGSICGCLEGSTCSQDNICQNNGVSGIAIKPLFIKGMRGKNTKTALECAGWQPENIYNDLLDFPCQNNSDCPQGDKCVNGFCDRNNIFSLWTFDPTLNPSCKKYLSESLVCAVPSSTATSFDVLKNGSPETCGKECKILSVCDSDIPSGSNDSNPCCPLNMTFSTINGKGLCVSEKEKCCLKNCETTDMPCSNFPQKANNAQITNGECGMKTTKNISINSFTINNPEFLEPCKGKYLDDSCQNAFYSGICKRTNDMKLRCFPPEMCVSVFDTSAASGICSENVNF